MDPTVLTASWLNVLYILHVSQDVWFIDSLDNADEEHKKEKCTACPGKDNAGDKS